MDKETQTEDFRQEDKFNQAPDDIMTAYKEETQFTTKKKRKVNEALALEKFMARAGPVMEQIVEENTKLWQASSSEIAPKAAAIELK